MEKCREQKKCTRRGVAGGNVTVSANNETVNRGRTGHHLNKLIYTSSTVKKKQDHTSIMFGFTNYLLSRPLIIACIRIKEWCQTNTSEYLTNVFMSPQHSKMETKMELLIRNCRFLYHLQRQVITH